MIPKNVLILAGLLTALGLPGAAPALDLAPREPAVRMGVSFHPDQFHAGFQVAMGAPARVRLRPCFDFGAGNGVRIGSLNADVIVGLGRVNARFRPYLGGGPGLNLIDVTNGVGEAQGVEAKLVGQALAGVVSTRPLLGAKRPFLEGRVGVGDTPDVKVVIGFWF